MTPKRLAILIALVVVGALPANASAILQVTPPQGDNVSGAINFGTLSPSPSVAALDANTSTYTTQSNEFNKCGASIYGKTIWSRFKTPRTGRIDITAAGFDSVIGLSPRTSFGEPGSGPCVDRLLGRIESFGRDNLPTVKKNRQYFIQVGGFANFDNRPDQTPKSGPLEVAVELLPPAVIEGADAGLKTQQVRGGVRVKAVRIDGPKGAKATVFCARKCGKRGRYSLKRSLFGQPLGRINLAARESDRAATAASNAPVRAAARKVFKGRKIKNGNTLFVRIQRTDQIGKLFSWRITKGFPGDKVIRCIEPNSTKVKKLGRCNGT
jgi:hypothetical protein